MAERWSDEHLAEVLGSVGRNLVVPEGVALVPRIGPARHPRLRPRVLVFAAAVVLAVLVALGSAITPVREAVAGWLGIGTTSVEHVPAHEADSTGLPRLSAGAVPVRTSQAEAKLGRPLPVIPGSGLGEPRLFVLPEGGVLMAWPEGRTTLWVRAEEGETAATVKKLLASEGWARPVAGLGESAMVIEGDHVLQTPSRRVAAGRVVLWLDDGLQLRLESELSRERMVGLARSTQL